MECIFVFMLNFEVMLYFLESWGSLWKKVVLRMDVYLIKDDVNMLFYNIILRYWYFEVVLKRGIFVYKFCLISYIISLLYF